jgi:hypothetical protein
MRRWLAPIAAVATAFALPGAAAADPTVVLEPNCSSAPDGHQYYDATFGVSGFPPFTEFSGDLEFQEIQPDGSLKPSFGVSGSEPTVADGSWIRTLGIGLPSVATFTVTSDLLPGGSETRSVTLTCEPTPPSAPKSKPRPKLVRQCKHGGYRRFGFKSKRRCIAYVKRGPRAR